MLRSNLGSSLVAKASPGAKLRETQEQKLMTPQIPGKGAIGSISRAGLEEPLKREVPAGSEKVVGVKPLVESQAGLPADLLAGGAVPPTESAIPEGAGPQIRSKIPSGNQNQALFQGGVGGNSSPSRQTTQQVSQGAPYVGYQAPQPENQGGQTKQSNQAISPMLPQTGVNQMAGGKVFAGEGQVPRTLAQKVVGGAGKVVSAVAPSLGNQMQSWGGQTITGNRSKAIPTPSFAQGVANKLRSVITNLFSGLRSSW